MPSENFEVDKDSLILFDELCNALKRITNEKKNCVKINLALFSNWCYVLNQDESYNTVSDSLGLTYKNGDTRSPIVWTIFFFNPEYFFEETGLSRIKVDRNPRVDRYQPASNSAARNSAKIWPRVHVFQNQPLRRSIYIDFKWVFFVCLFFSFLFCFVFLFLSCKTYLEFSCYWGICPCFSDYGKASLMSGDFSPMFSSLYEEVGSSELREKKKRTWMGESQIACKTVGNVCWGKKQNRVKKSGPFRHDERKGQNFFVASAHILPRFFRYPWLWHWQWKKIAAQCMRASISILLTS